MLKFNYASKINTYHVLGEKDKPVGHIEQNKDSPTWCFAQNRASDWLQTSELKQIAAFMEKLESAS